MGTDKYLFRSQFELSGNLALVFATVFSIWLCHHSMIKIHLWALILVGILLNYILLAIFQSRYYFYDNKIEKIFIFRPFCRKTVFVYEQLYKVKFKHIGTKGEYPKFIVYLKKKQYYKYFNNFIFNKHSKRVEIVEFLLSKNVKMEVRTDFEKKDKEIIDMVKKKYPQNIFVFKNTMHEASTSAAQRELDELARRNNR